MSSRLVRIGLWTALGFALAVTGYLLINTTLMPYDDEGFVLISLRNYLAGLRLYDDVFSQYGPWPYVYHQLATGNGHFPLTHLFGRGLTLAHWVAMSLLSGAIAWRLTRSQVAAMATAGLVFGLTWQMTSEPTHPGSMVSVLVALAGLMLARLPDAKRPALEMGILGAVTALLLLTKINVGLLLLAGAGCVIARHTVWSGLARHLAWLAATALLLVPWVLLGRQLSMDWALTFAGIFTAAAASLLWITPASVVPPRLSAAPILTGVIALLATGAAVCGVVLVRGTSAGALIDTVLLGPLRMPSRFVIPIHWYWPAIPVAATATLIALRAGWDLRRSGMLTPLAFWLVVAARGVGLAVFLLQITRWPTYYGIFHFVCYCLPALILFSIPLAPVRAGARRLAITAVATAALLQVLHAFPVAGSQLGWATFLCVPVLVSGLWETGHALHARIGLRVRRGLFAGAGLIVFATAIVLGLMLHAGLTRYSTSRPLGLPGAEAIYLHGRTALSLRLLRLNSQIHADVLFSRQGMYSHNLWSGVPTPTAQNATHWFWLLPEPQQRAIIARLAETPRSAIITSVTLDGFMVDFNVPVSGPLHEFILDHYRPLFTYGDYVFHVPHDSAAIPFGRFEILEASETSDAVAPLLLRATLVLDGSPAQIRMEFVDYPWSDGPALLGPGYRTALEPIDRTGRAVGPAIPLPHPKPLRGLFRLSISMPALPPSLPWQHCAVVVRDASGEVLAEAVY